MSARVDGWIQSGHRVNGYPVRVSFLSLTLSFIPFSLFELTSLPFLFPSRLILLFPFSLPFLPSCCSILNTTAPSSTHHSHSPPPVWQPQQTHSFSSLTHSLIHTHSKYTSSIHLPSLRFTLHSLILSRPPPGANTHTHTAILLFDQPAPLTALSRNCCRIFLSFPECDSHTSTPRLLTALVHPPTFVSVIPSSDRCPASTFFTFTLLSPHLFFLFIHSSITPLNIPNSACTIHILRESQSLSKT